MATLRQRRVCTYISCRIQILRLRFAKVKCVKTLKIKQTLCEIRQLLYCTPQKYIHVPLWNIMQIQGIMPKRLVTSFFNGIVEPHIWSTQAVFLLTLNIQRNDSVCRDTQSWPEYCESWRQVKVYHLSRAFSPCCAWHFFQQGAKIFSSRTQRRPATCDVSHPFVLRQV